MEVAVVILAGGKGSRFWPRSRTDQPKQFLPLVAGGPTLLQATYERARQLAGRGNVYAVLPQEYEAQVVEQVPALVGRLMLEPAARDTAPAVALSARLVVQAGRGDAVVVVMPADHYVPDEVAFALDVGTAVEQARAGGLWILGMRPVRPETAYGYIVPASGELSTVEAFIEKPEPARAQALVAGGALWNAGIFVARADVLASATQTCAPDVAAAVLSGTPEDYVALTPTSFDHAVLEHFADVHVVRATFPWDDVGTWTALERVVGRDEKGNVHSGSIVAEGTERTILVNDDPHRDLVALGVRDLVCVVTPGGVLVSSKEQAGAIKGVYAKLRTKTTVAGSVPVAMAARIVDKPWGREVWWAQSDRYVAKVLEVNSLESLSLQYHEVKSESVLVFGGSGTARVGDETLNLRPGVRFDVPPRTVHRFEAGKDGLVLLEVSTPEVEDIVRLEDRYGRSPTTRGVAG